MILRQNGSTVSKEYSRFVVCREMGWDYYTYELQPPFFLEEILIFLRHEAERQKDEIKKVESRGKTSNTKYSRH